MEFDSVANYITLDCWDNMLLNVMELNDSDLGFSRQEHWSGLPFPSPMHESEK